VSSLGAKQAVSRLSLHFDHHSPKFTNYKTEQYNAIGMTTQFHMQCHEKQWKASKAKQSNASRAKQAKQCKQIETKQSQVIHSTPRKPNDTSHCSHEFATRDFHSS
jgi:FtsZ-interacting cell division protein YlmF